MILASAIKFHIEATNKNVILCGVRHSDIFKQLKSLGFKPREGYTELEQGFIDHRGRFLLRKEAYKHAKECGQLSSTTNIAKSNDELFSEDLW